MLLRHKVSFLIDFLVKWLIKYNLVLDLKKYYVNKGKVQVRN